MYVIHWSIPEFSKVPVVYIMKAASILDLKPLIIIIIISLRYLNPTNYKKLLHTEVFLQKVRKKRKYFYKIIKKKLSSRIRELEQEDNVWLVPHYLV